MQRLEARVHQHEAAGAVRVLGHSRLEAGLAEERRLLVPGDAAERNLAAAEPRDCVAAPEHGGHDPRQNGARNA